MSFSWWIEDKEGNDLLAGCNKQMLGLGYDSTDSSPSPYSLQEIRIAWSQVPYKDKCKEAAVDAFNAVRRMVSTNLNSLKKKHECPCCTCEEAAPFGWSVEEINKVLAIDPEKVWRAGGGW